MAFINWTTDLQVNHPEIDAQHQTLVDTINTLHAAMKQGKGKEELGKTLVFLKDYTVSHFATEEALMAKHGYPESPRHKQKHADLLAQVGDLVDKHQKGGMVLTMAVMDFLQDWLEKHIQGEDKRLAEFLRKG